PSGSAPEAASRTVSTRRPRTITTWFARAAKVRPSTRRPPRITVTWSAALAGAGARTATGTTAAAPRAATVTGRADPVRPERRPHVAGAAEGEHREEDDPQQRQADPVERVLAERLGEVDADDDPDHEVHARDQHQHEPPERAADDLEQHDHVVDRHDARPAG